MIAYKFLTDEGRSPFTGFRWPRAGEWVEASAERPHAWVHACRIGDLPYWLERELWTVELDAPVREARYQVSAPRARLVGRVEGWDEPLARELSRSSVLHARDLALPHLPPPLREVLQAAEEPAAIASALAGAGAGAPLPSYLSDAARLATRSGPSAACYVARVLAAAVGGGQAAYDAECAWQARWMAHRLGIANAASLEGPHEP
jgi:hypothetical protein